MTDHSFAFIVGGMERVGEEWRAHVSDNWMQGRTCYGGASAALALAAVQRDFSELPPLRSAQIAFVGPMGGEIGLRTALLRQGKSATFVRCDAYDGAAHGMTATFLFGGDRVSHIDHVAAARSPLPPRGEYLDPPPMVNFARNFEHHVAVEPSPGVPAFSRWARVRERGSLDPMVELLLIADVLPPAAMMLFKHWGPISTVAWQLDVLDPDPFDQDGWVLTEAEAEQAVNGFSTQGMTVHAADGRLAAVARQMVALFA